MPGDGSQCERLLCLAKKIIETALSETENIAAISQELLF